MPRISPLPKPEWSPEMTAFVDGFRSAVIGKKPTQENQSGSHLLGTLARYPALAQPFLTFNRHLLSGTSLTARQRELLVLRVAHLRQCGYEWAQHVILGERAGLTSEEIARISGEPTAAQWKPLDRAMLAAVDELLADGIIADVTWTTLSGELTEDQLMDLVFTVGTYAMVAMTLRSFGIEPEEALRPYLPDQQKG
ncbi:carboxymuconolactone decarboxylase family protein [Nocardia sp. CA2R105]|uniref:carboxymuconolactone decarboxylase family protein n=1 Tax=Nocardia coffeae TaxID=2873381 RepID=UPI001CA61099|nr:carboxymuconolactone decarboxylase family protein [Nocardia coffeae]MBY8859842.1 carboxymuconolactone decarboxylase family protein [Nocardia coffeae]